MRKKRLCAAGAIGAFYSAVLLFVRMTGPLHIMMKFLGMSLLLCRTAFPFSSQKKLGIESIVFCVLAFVTGGMLDAFYYASGMGSMLREGDGIVSTARILMLSLGMVAFLVWSIRNGEVHVKRERLYAEVEIVFPEGQVCIIGLFDTGNRLKVQGKPVGVLEEEIVQSIFGRSECFPVFYQSVGRKEGVLPARKAEKIRIRTKEEEFVVLEPVVAFSREKLSSDGTYRMLLPVDWRDI